MGLGSSALAANARVTPLSRCGAKELGGRWAAVTCKERVKPARGAVSQVFELQEREGREAEEKRLKR